MTEQGLLARILATPRHSKGWKPLLVVERENFKLLESLVQPPPAAAAERQFLTDYAPRLSFTDEVVASYELGKLSPTAGRTLITGLSAARAYSDVVFPAITESYVMTGLAKAKNPEAALAILRTLRMKINDQISDSKEDPKINASLDVISRHESQASEIVKKHFKSCQWSYLLEAADLARVYLGLKIQRTEALMGIDKELAFSYLTEPVRSHVFDAVKKMWFRGSVQTPQEHDLYRLWTRDNKLYAAIFAAVGMKRPEAVVPQILPVTAPVVITRPAETPRPEPTPRERVYTSLVRNSNGSVFKGRLQTEAESLAEYAASRMSPDELNRLTGALVEFNIPSWFNRGPFRREEARIEILQRLRAEYVDGKATPHKRGLRTLCLGVVNA